MDPFVLAINSSVLELAIPINYLVLDIAFAVTHFVLEIEIASEIVFFVVTPWLAGSVAAKDEVEAEVEKPEGWF